MSLRIDRTSTLQNEISSRLENVKMSIRNRTFTIISIYQHNNYFYHRYEISISQMTMNLLPFTYIIFLAFIVINYIKTRRMSHKKQELLTTHKPWFSGGGCFAPIFSFMCCVFCIAYLSSSCVLCPMLQLSVDCPFLIVLSLFSNINVDIKFSAHDAFLESPS
jgi:hypothetical protein